MTGTAVYPALMRILRVFLAAALAGAALPAAADTITRIDIHGLSPEQEANVRRRLSLEKQLGRELGEQRLDYLLLESEREARSALEPYGYFSPEIHITPPAGGEGVLLIEIVPGEPVRVRSATVAVSVPGQQDPMLSAAVTGFAPASGDVFDQVIYETSKARINRGLADRGYFDAEFGTHRVEVTRAEHAADIALAWSSGRRYQLGRVHYEQLPKEIIDPAVLEKIKLWEAGTPWDQARLDHLRESLAKLDYFSAIDIAPVPAQAHGDAMPV